MKMKKTFQYISVLFVMIFWLSCDIFVELNNVFDPQDDRYFPPTTEFLSGPNPGDTLTQNVAVFTWHHPEPSYWPDSTGYLIPASIEYSYRVNFQSWSLWKSGFNLLEESNNHWTFETTSGTHSFEMIMLDDQDYVFEVKSRYPTDILEEEWPIRDFKVDALEGPSLTTVPLLVYANTTENFTVSVKAEEVDQMMGTHILIEYDPEVLTLNSYQLQSEEDEFLLQSNAINIEEFTFIDHNAITGIFDLNIALAGGSFNGVSGSGNIIEFNFSSIQAVSETFVTILPESTIRNIYNETTVNEIRSGIVVIQYD